MACKPPTCPRVRVVDAPIDSYLAHTDRSIHTVSSIFLLSPRRNPSHRRRPTPLCRRRLRVVPHTSPATLMSAFAPIPGYATTRRTVVQGTGAEVAKGDKVTVHAKGTVKETNKVFWSTKDPGQKPFTYDAGVGAVITGTPRDDATMRRRAPAFTRPFVHRRDASTDDESIPINRSSRRVGPRLSRRQGGRGHRTRHSRARRVRCRWISGVGDSSERHAVV